MGWHDTRVRTFLEGRSGHKAVPDRYFPWRVPHPLDRGAEVQGAHRETRHQLHTAIYRIDFHNYVQTTGRDLAALARKPQTKSCRANDD